MSFSLKQFDIFFALIKFFSNYICLVEASRSHSLSGYGYSCYKVIIQRIYLDEVICHLRKIPGKIIPVSVFVSIYLSVHEVIVL